jgi:hypothetical protein
MDAKEFDALLRDQLRTYLSKEPNPQKSNISLSFKDCKLTDDNLKALLTYCLKKGLSLSTLKIELSYGYKNSECQLTDHGWNGLFRALKTPALSNIQTLKITHATIGDGPIVLLGQALKARAESDTGSGCHELDLSWCRMSETAWVNLWQDMKEAQATYHARKEGRKSYYRNFVGTLHASGMRITDATVQALADYFAVNNANYSVWLGWTDLSEPRHVQLLADGIKRGKSGYIHLSGNKIQDPTPLIDAWATTSKSELLLSGNKLGSHTDQSWVARLPEIEHLTTIKLEDNDLGDDFAEAFGRALTRMPKVRKFDLSDNAFTSAGVAHIFAGLSGRVESICLKPRRYLDELPSLDDRATLAVAKYLVNYFRKRIRKGSWRREPKYLDFQASFMCERDPKLAHLTQDFLSAIYQKEYDEDPTERRHHKKNYFRLKHHLASYDAAYAVTQGEMDAWNEDKANLVHHSYSDPRYDHWEYDSDIDYEYDFKQLEQDVEQAKDSFSDTSDEDSASALETLFSVSSSSIESEQAAASAEKRKASYGSANEVGFFRELKFKRQGAGDVAAHRADEAVHESYDLERDEPAATVQSKVSKSLSRRDNSRGI